MRVKQIASQDENKRTSLILLGFQYWDKLS